MDRLAEGRVFEAGLDAPPLSFVAQSATLFTAGRFACADWRELLLPQKSKMCHRDDEGRFFGVIRLAFFGSTTCASR